ncbi:MAG: alpha-L-fucosidase [Planctomycetota bacterium]
MKPLSPIPTPTQLAWQRTETNLFVHISPNTFTGREWGDGREDPRMFDPAELDCGQWARAAKAGGFRIGVLTAKHHDGFCLWPTATTDHSVASSPWRGGRGDLVREFVEAFRAEGLDVGLYLSPWDRNAACYGDSAAYNAFYLRQLTELLTGYGPLREVWFDGACGEGANGKKQEYDWGAYFETVKRLQPGAVMFGDGGTDVRWVGNEEGHAGETCWGMTDSRVFRHPGDAGLAQPTGGQALADRQGLLYHGSEDGDEWRPAESDVSIRPGWFYHPEEDERVRTVEGLVDLYFRSVGRNSVLLLNVPPMPNGLMHEVDVERLAGFRSALDRSFAHDLTAGHEVRFHELEGGDGVLAEVEWGEAQEVSVVMLGEAIESGQRIAEHRVQGWVAGAWVDLVSGSTVGCKRLYRMEPVRVGGLRVVMDRSRGGGLLTGLGAYPPVD